MPVAGKTDSGPKINMKLLRAVRKKGERSRIRAE